MLKQKRYTKQQEIVVESGIEFTYDMLQLSPNSPRREYYRRKAEGEIKTMVHWGQRKLLISELEFLIFFWNPQEIPHPVIVYAGAARGDHIPLILKLFPSIDSLHLYDPAPFVLKETDKIHIYNQLFTIEEAKKWSERDDVFFISDIRTGDYKIMTSEQNNFSILQDMELQRQCVEIMNPVQSHLKFRLPYSDSDPNYLKLIYFDANVLLQPWAPYTSTETRLFPIKDQDSGKYKKKVWDAIAYEEQLFYHNTVLRSNQLFLNPLIYQSKIKPIDPPELNNDYDSVAEVFILKSYFEKFGIQPTSSDICKLSKWITSELNNYTKYEKSIDILRKKSIELQHKEIIKERHNRANKHKRKKNKSRKKVR